MSEGTEISVYGCQCMNGCEQCREVCCQQCCQQQSIDKEREEETEMYVYGCQCMNGCEECREICCQQCCQQQSIDKETEKKMREETEKKMKDETEKKMREETEKKMREETEKKMREETEKKMREETEKKMREETEKKMKDETKKKMKDKAEKKMRDDRIGNVSKNNTATNPSPPQNISFGMKVLIGALLTSVIITIAVITGFVVYASSNHCVGCNTTLTTTPNMTNFPNLTIEHPRIPNFENENTTEPPVIEIKMDAISYATNASTLKTAERETRTNLTANTTAPFELSIEKEAQSINSATITDPVSKNFLGEKLDNLDSSPENLTPSLALSIDKAVLGISGSKTDSSLVSSQQQKEDKATAPLQLTIEKDVQSINSATITDTDVSKNFLRPFSCPICKRRFKRIERLQRHSLIHQS